MDLGYPADMPVLSVQLSGASWSEFRKVLPKKIDIGSVSILAGDVLTIAIRRGSILMQWLADMTDPEIWTAFDTWRSHERIAVVFTAGEECRFESVEFTSTYSSLKCRDKISRHGKPGFLTAMSALTSSGFLEAQTINGLAGASINAVSMNLMRTSRFYEEEIGASSTEYEQ